MTLFKNKYRAESARLKNWDYSSAAFYYITICTKNRECFFGSVINDKMELSDTGKMANKFWQEIPEHFGHVKLHEFVIMPNHVHGILEIDKLRNIKTRCVEKGVVETQRVQTPRGVETPKLGVSTTTTSSFPSAGVESRKCASIGVVVNQYKRICTIETRKINTAFAWQSRFYDRIIRDDNEFKNIREYINNNPAKWSADDYFGGRL